MINKSIVCNKLEKLREQARKIKEDEHLRHEPNEHVLKEASDNAFLMSEPQFNSIKVEVFERGDCKLKKHDAITVDTKVIGTLNGDVEVYCCRDCRTILDPTFHYCPNCGQEVKWDD